MITRRVIGQLAAGKRMALNVLRMTCLIMPVLVVPAYSSSETAETTKQRAGNREGPPPTGPKTGTSSVSQGEPDKQAAQKDVKSRGLFSKKKKKKSTGGGSAHSESQEHRGRQLDDAHAP